MFRDLFKKKSDKDQKIIPQVKLERAGKAKKKQKTPKGSVGPSGDKKTSAIGTINVGSVARPKPQFKDEGKRRRIIFIAVLIVFVIFGLKVWNKDERWSFGDALLVAIFSSAFAYIGQIWAFKFDVNKKGFFTVLPIPSIFTFGSVLFLELFFFREFERIYEVLFFAVILIIFAVVYSVVFLTANVLNVGTVREIPLMRVAHTFSYIISILSQYFITFSLISVGLDLYLLLPLILVSYTVTNFLHLSHFSLSFNQIKWYAIALGWAAMVVVMSLTLWPLGVLFISLVPVAVSYIGLGFIMHKIGKTFDGKILAEYIFIAVLVILVVIVHSKWGMGEYFWG